MLLRVHRAVVASRIRPLRFFSTENDEKDDGFYDQFASSVLEEPRKKPPWQSRIDDGEKEMQKREAMPKKVLEDRPAIFPEREGESEVDREIRAHNTSLFNLKHQTIVGKVVAVGKKEVLVDLGWKDYQSFLKSELALSQIYRGEQTVDESIEKDHENQKLRPGDELQFRIEEIGTPHGEIFVSTRTMRADIRRQLVWEELRDAFKNDVKIQGRVLNPCNGGYAVGIAGFVAFCPLFRMNPPTGRRIGVLQEFKIVLMSEKVGANLIVNDPTIIAVGRPLRF